ncbi:MAG: hypothetical protein KA368_23105 [Acidobacteria bacterium]|nr:hypothetical protein [Acidobacteriota bacterium]
MVSPASLPPIHSIPEQHCLVFKSSLRKVSFGASSLDLSEATIPVVQVAGQTAQTPPDTQGTDSSQTNNQAAAQAEKRTFWERVFKIPPVSKRLEKSLTEDWKFTDIRPRNIEWLLSEEGEEARMFFLQGGNARQYQRLVKEYGCGFETRTGRVVDDTFDTLSEYGPELIQNYSILMDNRATIKRYYAGVFRDGRIGTQALIRISSSMWFGPFEAPRFRQFAGFLRDRFQVPEHVIGPMLGSVGDSLWLRQVMSRRTSPQEFQQILTKIAPSSENSGNAFAPALQLLVIGEEHKIPFNTLIAFLDDLKLKPKDFGPFSAIEFNLGAYRMANEIKCPTFAQYVRQLLDEYGQDINQESARMLLFSYREFKENGEALQSMLSPKYNETKAFLKSVGTVSSNIWNLQRIAILTQTLTPEKKAKITKIARALAAELTVADIMFIAEIADNDDEVKMLLDRKALVAGVKDIRIDRIVERSHNDLVKELEREIDNANSNGLYRTVRRLRGMINKEKEAYTERVDPDKLTNVQLSRLLIFHRSLDVPGFMDTVGWNVSLDLQNDRSEGGGYLGYDKDMAMVTMIAGQPGDNRQYRPVNLNRAPASLALFHNHAFKDTFAQKYLGFVGKMFPFLPKNKDKNSYAGPSGWVGSKKGDITAAAESELPSFIITKIGYPQNPDGSKDKKKLLVNFDWVVVDKLSGEALRSDRGVFTVPYYSDEELGKLKWPSRKEMRRRDRELREKCPPMFKNDTVVGNSGQQR